MARSGYTIVGNRVANARMALLREEDGKPLSQEDLAERTHLHRVTIAKIEAGDAKVSLETLERLCQELDVSREWLLGEPDPVDEITLAREAIADSLAAVRDTADRMTELMGALEQRLRSTVDDADARKVAIR